MRVDKGQQDPNVGERVVLDYLCNTLLPDDAWQDIKLDLTKRAKEGKKKYGTYLMTFNGRSAMLDLYQELLDGIMYATQAYMECKDEENSEWLLDLMHVLLEEIHGVREYLIRIEGVNLDGDSDEVRP